jgi:protein gp37
MSANTKIEWADHTFNPWIGCTKVGPGCDNCYAEADFDKRRHVVQWGAGQERKRTTPSTWAQPIKWNAKAFYECTCCGWRGHANDPEYSAPRNGCIHDLVPARARVFCASLADVFDNAVPQHWRTALFALIYDTPNLDWLLLSKRIGNAAHMLHADAPEQCSLLGANNVWLGATITSQEEADRDIPKLLAVPAAKRFLSMEPLLGPVDIGLLCENWSTDILMDPETGACECCKRCDYTGIGNDIDWVIVGGESGPGARPMHPDWARSLRDQCEAAGVPFMMKQMGGVRDKLGALEDLPEDLRVREFPV